MELSVILLSGVPTISGKLERSDGDRGTVNTKLSLAHLTALWAFPGAHQLGSFKLFP